MAALVAVFFVTASQASCDQGIAADKGRNVWISFPELLAYDFLESFYMSLVRLAATIALLGLLVASALIWWSRRTITIRTASELFRLSWLVPRLRSRASSPSLTNPAIMVINVAHEEWQGAVRMLMGTGAPVLIDVSRPGEGLLWEVTELMKSHVPTTLIAESHDLQRWRHTQHDEQSRLLSDAIGNRAIIEYDANSGQSARDLARQLRAILPLAGRSRRSIRFAAMACVTFILYFMITFEVMPWPESARAWVNDMSFRYLGYTLVSSY